MTLGHLVRKSAVGLMLLAVLASAAPAAARNRGGGDIGGQLRAASDDYSQTVSEGTVLGAVAGAVIGGAIGAAQGRNVGGAIGGAAIGALAGGLLGNLGGQAVAGTKADYAHREDQLDKAIAHARASNAKLGSLVATAGRLVATRRAELARLSRSDDPAGRSELSSHLSTEIGVLDDAIAKAKDARDTIRRNVDNYRGRGGGALAGEADRTDSQIAALQARRSELADMSRGL